jgi:hypothetical protein
VNKSHFTNVLTRVSRGNFPAVDGDGNATRKNEVNVIVDSALANNFFLARSRIERNQFSGVCQFGSERFLVFHDLLKAQGIDKTPMSVGTL